MKKKEKLLAKLKECSEEVDSERAHCKADSALIEYLNDKEIEEAYAKIEKWYA